MARRQRVDRLVLPEHQPLQVASRDWISTSASHFVTVFGGMRAIVATVASISFDRDLLLALALGHKHLRRAGLVDHVDRLVRQLAVVDVLGRQLDRRLDRLVRVLELVDSSSKYGFSPFRISIASSTVGSLTSIFWNRRTSARSFSKCCRYSLYVVEPMQRSTPDCSAGFSRFEASIAPPDVAPAPMTVWISSMNRIAPS